jgi:hypothetical protein
MAGFLSILTSVAVPVVQIAAQLLPMILAAAKGTTALSGDPVKTGLVRWLPDGAVGKVYADNLTDSTIVLSFTMQAPNPENENLYELESFATTILPAHAIDATAMLAAYGEGSFSNNYMHPLEGAGTPGQAAANPLMGQIVKYIPLLVGATFSLFGGGIEFSRGTKDGISFWKIMSTARLDWVSFRYRTAEGASLDFNTPLENTTPPAPTIIYNITMDGADQSTGVLQSVEIKIQGEPKELAKLLRAVEQIPVAKLPGHVRALIAA